MAANAGVGIGLVIAGVMSLISPYVFAVLNNSNCQWVSGEFKILGSSFTLSMIFCLAIQAQTGKIYKIQPLKLLQEL